MRFGLKIAGIAAWLFLGLLVVMPTQLAIAEGVPQPDIAKAAKGDACIAPTGFMRRNHMELLKHDRDQAVHLGNRTIKASLKECVSCHVVNGADSKPVTVKDPKHFCRSCHDYVAVKIDCFECHASRPELTLKSKLNPHSPEAKALAAYVKGDDQ